MRLYQYRFDVGDRLAGGVGESPAQASSPLRSQGVRVEQNALPSRDKNQKRKIPRNNPRNAYSIRTIHVLKLISTLRFKASWKGTRMYKSFGSRNLCNRESIP